MPNSDLVKVKTALISVSDKTDLLVLAAALKDCGVQVSLYPPPSASGVQLSTACASSAPHSQATTTIFAILQTREMVYSCLRFLFF